MQDVITTQGTSAQNKLQPQATNGSNRATTHDDGDQHSFQQEIDKFNQAEPQQTTAANGRQPESEGGSRLPHDETADAAATEQQDQPPLAEASVPKQQPAAPLELQHIDTSGHGQSLVDPAWQSYFASLAVEPAAAATDPVQTAGLQSATTAQQRPGLPANMRAIAEALIDAEQVPADSSTQTGSQQQSRQSTAPLAASLANPVNRSEIMQTTNLAVAQGGEIASSESDKLLNMQMGSDSTGGQTPGKHNMFSTAAFIQSGINAAAPQSGDTAPAFSSLLNSTATLTQSSSLQSTQPVMQSGISEAFGSPNWSQGLGKQLMLMVNQNIQTAELRMNPANLGPIEVRIEMDDDQVNVAFSSRHAAVRDAMELAMPKLREMLDQNGLNLADSDISHQSFAEQDADASADSSDLDNMMALPGETGDESDTESATMDGGRTTAYEVPSVVDYYI